MSQNPNHGASVLSGRRGQARNNYHTSFWHRWWRRAAVIVVVLGFAVLHAPVVIADPVDPATVPANLRQYVPDSAEWAASPWMTASSCRNHGGDWSIYASYLIKDMPDLLAVFQPDFAGNDANASKRKDLLVRGYRDVAANISAPGGYCVDLVKKWAKPNPEFQPFGFEWGNVEYDWSKGSGPDQHGVFYHAICSQVDKTKGSVVSCRGFYLSCDGAITQQEDQSCQAWNAFSDDYVKRMNTVIEKAYTQYGVVNEDGKNQTKTVIKSPGEVAQEFLNWIVKKGMEQVVSFIVAGVTKLWGVFTRIAVDYSSPNLTGVAFTSVYNLVAGVALALAFLGWLITLATSWKRGHLQYSLLGGVKAAVGVTLAAVGAILMLQLADDCTRSLVSAGGDIARQADFTTSLAKANPLVAILAGVLIAISLIFSIIFLVINGPLVEMWALFGSVAAAGQVHQASSGWLLRWAARLTALAWAKFFMVAVMLLAQLLLLPLDAGEDPVRQVVDVIQGLALCLLVVLCPWLLWELVDFVGDRVGGAAASGGVASRAAGTGTSRTVRATGGALGTAGAAVGSAVGAMVVAAAQIGRHFPGGSTSGGGHGGSGPTSVPRTESDAVDGAGPSPEEGSRRENPAPVPPSVGVGGSAGGSDQLPPKAPANRGRVVASAASLPRTTSAGSAPAANVAPRDVSTPAPTTTRSGASTPRIPPPA
jgi:hypothetical protein